MDLLFHNHGWFWRDIFVSISFQEASGGRLFLVPFQSVFFAASAVVPFQSALHLGGRLVFGSF